MSGELEKHPIKREKEKPCTGTQKKQREVSELKQGEKGLHRHQEGMIKSPDGVRRTFIREGCLALDVIVQAQ